MKNKQILVDVDGCLLDWKASFINFMLDKGYQINEKDVNMYRMENYFNIPVNKAVNYIHEFNDGNWRFGTLPEIKDSVKWMKLLSAKDFRFVAISSCSDTQESLNLRKVNLYHLFDDIFDEVHCIKMHSSKSNLLSQYDPTFWIEDQMMGALQGLENNHECLLLDHPWNQNDNHNEIKRVNDWSEIYVHIMKENK